MSSRDALIERKKARAAKKRAAEEAAKANADGKKVVPDPSEEETEDGADSERVVSLQQAPSASEDVQGYDLEFRGEGVPSKRLQNKDGRVERGSVRGGFFPKLKPKLQTLGF